MKNLLLFQTILFFSLRLFPQSPCDTIVSIDEKNNRHPEIATIAFETTPKTRYAFDLYRDIYSNVPEYFLKYKPSDDAMIASAKFIEAGQSDELFVRIKERKVDFDPQKVRFLTGNGKEYKGVYDPAENGWTLTLIGGEAGDGQEIYAVYETSPGKAATLDMLRTYSYTPQTVQVKLIPVNGFTNGFTASNVAQSLNDIYNKAGVTCEVSIADNFNYDPLKNRAFDVTGSGLFSTQTADMKALNNAYLQAHPDEKAVCLFIIEKVSGAEGVAGDMPRGKQFGYLFPGSNVRTIAHEIGHGVFKLEHPFDRPLRGQFKQGDLPFCVMDYPPGTEFCKLEWDAIHSPGLVIGLFEKDEAGMYAEKNYMVLEKDGVFFTPTGNPLYLSKGTKIYSPMIDFSFVPNWPVYIFENKQDKYIASANIQTGNPIFYGYVKEGNNSEKYDESINRPKVGSSVIVTLVKHRSEAGYDIISLYESEQPYKIPNLILDNRMLMVDPSVGNTKKIDESNKLKPVDIKNITSGGEVFSQTIDGKYSISITQEGEKYTTVFKLLGKSANGTIQGQKDAIEQEVQNDINEKLNELGLEGKTSDEINDDGFYVARMNGKQWIETLVNLGTAVWEEATLPKDYWNQEEANYQNSTVKTPALFAGVSDGVIDQITTYPQLIKLGYNVATKAEVRRGLWNAVKNISVESIKNAAIDFYEQKKNNYTSNKSYIVDHTVAKDATELASIFIGSTGLKGAAKDVDDGVERTGKEILSEVDDALVKGVEGADGLAKKSLKEAIDNGTFERDLVEGLTSEVNDVAANKGRKLSWDEVQKFFKRGNDFNAKASKDYPYNEVTLANGKRLDSYIEGEKIVSRKATTLSEIKPETFEEYLKELKSKYPIGEPISAPKYGTSLKGKVLEGQQVLEIPESNMSFHKIQEYINLAKNKYNIVIEFKPE